MKNAVKILVYATVLVCGLALPAIAKERALERELAAESIETIALDGGNGSARVVVGEDDVVKIRVTVRPDKLSDKSPWSGIKKWFLSSAYEDIDDLIDAIELDTSGRGRLSVGLAPPKRTRDSRVAEDWQLTVPQRLAVKIAMDRADTEVTDVAGGVAISVGNGKAVVDVPGGDLDIDVTVGKARVRTGSTDVRELSLRSQVGDTNLWMNGMKVEYTDPPGPGSKIAMSGKGDDSIRVFVQVGDASLRVNDAAE